MCDSQLTEPPFRVEGLSDILRRRRPNIDDVWPEVFGKLKQGSVVSVTGRGKSLMVMEVIARILIRKDNSRVLLVDVEQHFNIMKLVEISINLLQQQRDDRDFNQSLIEAQLSRLAILTCYEEDFVMIAPKIEKILGHDETISLVLVDSLGFFYYAASCDALENGRFLNKGTYLASFLKEFKNLAKKYETTIVSTIPEFMSENSKHLEKFTTHLITLKRKLDSISFTVKHKDSTEDEMYFKIKWYGFQLLQLNDSSYNTKRTK